MRRNSCTRGRGALQADVRGRLLGSQRHREERGGGPSPEIPDLDSSPALNDLGDSDTLLRPGKGWGEL